MDGNIVAKKIQEDLKSAVRAQDKPRISTLRMMISALKNAELDEREELTEEKELAVLSSYARRCRESIAEFERGGREDLVARERLELELVLSYLPPQMNEEEIRAQAKKTIQDTGAAGPRDIGKVMGIMMKNFKGQVDGAVVKRIVSEILGSG
ncbi:MAG: GatB/YqeY domain-containing protein [Candidatus Krumholzibacteriota bacterium]|nr:GatB/YqeY domain-containing protein [Candidatus Krumholzibacteriota bacterium]